MAFLPEIAVIVQFAIAIFIIAITPGPDMTLFVGRALSEGRAAGFACLFGSLTGIAVHTTLVSLGLSALIIASPEAFLALKIGGAGYLVYLAWQAVRHGSVFVPEKRGGNRHTLLKNWLTGLGIDLLNPKVALFYMTFLPQFVSVNDPNATAKLFFLGFLFIPLSLVVNAPMIIAADRFSALLRGSPRVTRVIDYAFAGVFSAFAVKILTAQAK